MKNKINWKLISDIVVIISMTAVLIGYTFLAIEIKQCKQRLDNLEIKYQLFEEDMNQLNDIDPGIKKVN